MNIKSTYVSFEQARLLKEKGFNVSLYNFYYQENEKSNPFLSNGMEYESDRDCKWDWNSSIIPYPNDAKGIYHSAPEQWQVVEWLRLNHGIWVYVTQGYKWKWNIETVENNPRKFYNDGLEDSPQEAYSAAFDHILMTIF